MKRVASTKRGRKKPPMAAKAAMIKSSTPGISDKKAIIKAGYSPRTNAGKVKATLSYQSAIQSVDQQRRVIQQQVGKRFSDIVQRLDDMSTNSAYKDFKSKARDAKGKEQADLLDQAHDEYMPPGERVRATKEIISILGYNAPTDINISSQSLFMEFTGLSSDDLRAVQSYYNNRKGAE